MLRNLVVFIIFFLPVVFAKNVTLDLQNANTRDAIQVIAKFIDMNVIISPSVTGVTSLHLQDMPAEQALDTLLNAQGFARLKINNAWFISSRTEWIASKQEEVKLKEIEEESAPLLMRIWQIHYAKAENISHLLQDATSSFLSKRGRVHIDARTNIVCMQDTAERLIEVNRLIKRIDIPVQQVLIEARLASIDSDYERQLGVDFSLRSTQGDQAESVGKYSLALARLADGALLDVKLTALENAGHGELISNPKLFTANQQPAAIEAGEEIPYQEISRSGATGIAFKKAVLSLQVTPQIMPDGEVLLQLQINQDKPSNRLVLGVPAINTRQISTNILVKNGQTIVLGGIYEINKENAQQRIPFLGKIPLVGWLFQQQNVKENKRELLIFVTPKIILDI